MICVNLYLVMYTRYWPVTVLILIWLAFDWKTPERGKGPAGATIVFPLPTILRGLGQFPGSLQPVPAWATEVQGRGLFKGLESPGPNCSGVGEGQLVK